MKHRDWFERLDAVLDLYRLQGFAWGERDCFTLPMDCVAAQTGADPWADERTYTTEIGAARKLKRLGFADVGDAFSARLDEVHTVRAGRGDIGTVLDAEGRPCGVVVLGAYVLGMSPVHGLTTLPRSRLARAFKVI